MPKLQPYPDVMNAVPDIAFGKSESFTFNPEYVLDAQRVVNVALGLKCVGTTIQQYGSEAGGVLCVRVMESLYYIVMPLRLSSNSAIMPPDWLKNLRPAPVAPNASTHIMPPAEPVPSAPADPAKIEKSEPSKPV